MTMLADSTQVERPWVASPGAPATFDEVAQAQFDKQRDVRNTFAIQNRIEQEIDERLDRIKAATGEVRDNPMRPKRGGFFDIRPTGLIHSLGGGLYEWNKSGRAEFKAWLDDLELRHPQHREAIAASYVPGDMEARWARLSEQRADEIMQRRGVTPSGLTGVPFLGGLADLAQFAGTDPEGFAAATFGSVTGMLEDPFNIAAMLVGPLRAVGVGTKSVLWSGVKQGAANMGVEAVQAPGVQAWRAQAGLEHGWGEAWKDIQGAFGAGLAMDVGIRSAYRGARRFQGRTPELDAQGGVIGWRQGADAPVAPQVADATSPRSPDAVSDARVDVPDYPGRSVRALDPEDRLDAAARDLPPEDPIRRAAEGDEQALADLAHATKATDDPAVRGALAELEHDRLWGPPPEVEKFDHIERLTDAINRAMDPAQPPPGDAIRVTAADASPVPARPLSPEAQAARTRLHAQEGSVTDLALLMRDHPEALDGTPHLSDHKTKQALAIAGLDEAAFRRVAAGEIAPNHGALIGRHAGNFPGEHSALVDLIARAKPRNEAEARLLIGDHLHAAEAGRLAPHTERQGGVTARELAPERARVLAGGLKTLIKDGRFGAVIEAEAARIEAGLAVKDRGSKAVRKQIGDRLTTVIETLSRTDSHVSELLDQAALAMQSGIKHKVASQAFAERVAAVLERDGLDGLMRRTGGEPERAGNAGPQLHDPHGPEAEAQIKALEQRIKFSNPGDRNDRNGRAATAPQTGGTAGQGSPGRGGQPAGGQPGTGAGAGAGASAPNQRGPGPQVARQPFGDKRTLTVVSELKPDGLDYRVYYVHAAGAAGPSAKASPKVTAQMLGQVNNWLARVQLNEREPGRFEIDMVKVDPRHKRKGIGRALYDAIERDLGRPLEPSGQLTEQGYAFWRGRNADMVQHHRYLASMNMWLSPRHMLFHRDLLEEFLQQKVLSPRERAEAKTDLAEIMRQLDTVPRSAKTASALRERWQMSWANDLTPAAAADWPAVRAEVDKVINRLPPGVRAEVRDRLVFGGVERDGFWDPHERLMAIAMNERAAVTARHEEVHTLRALGLFTENEWQVMAEFARRNGLAEKYDVEARWGDDIRAQIGEDDLRVREALLEETIAEMRGRHTFGERYGGIIDAAFARIGQFLERLRNALEGRGFQSAHDVFRRIDSGEVGARPLLGSGVGAALATRLSTPPPVKPSRNGIREHERFDVPPVLGAALGNPRGTVWINVAHILASREAKGGAEALNSPPAVRAFVEDVLSNASFAMQYKKGDATYNFIRMMPDGSGRLVAMDVMPNAHGHYPVRTAFPMTRDGLQRKLRGTAASLGRDGFQILPGRQEALGELIANVSEAHRAAPGTSTATLLERLSQEQRVADELSAKKGREAMVDETAVPEMQRQQAEAAAQMQREIDKMFENPAQKQMIEAERTKDLGALAEACKR